MHKENQGLFMRHFKWILIIVLCAVLDQWSKSYALQNLIYHEPKEIFQGLNLTLNFNHGVAFGMFSKHEVITRWVLVGFVFFITTVLSVWLFKTPKEEKLQALSLALIIGGALGNLWDRIFRGSVVDFIDFFIGGWHWHTFNIADSFVCVGAFLLCLSSFKCSKLSEKNNFAS